MDVQEDQQPDETNNNSNARNINIDNIDGDMVMGDHNVTNNYYANSPKPVPNQLQSRRTDYFVGRTDHLSTIQQNLRPGKKLAIVGPGGMGKTTLALEAIHQMGDQLQTLFPDGIIFHTFYGKSQLALAFESLIGAYEKSAGDPEQQARDVMGGKRALVILDGCEEVRESQGLRRLTDLLAHCGVLITSREIKHGRLGHLLDLRKLDKADALALLTKLAHPNPVAEETGLDICKRVDDLPLAIDIAGNYLRERGEPAADYLKWLKEEPLKAVDHGETRSDSVHRLLFRSVGHIENKGCDILLLLGLLAYLPVPTWLIDGVLGAERRSLDLHLRQLNRYGLIAWEPGGMVCAHALVHGYARDEHTGEGVGRADLQETLWRWLEENLYVWQKETPPRFGNCDAVRGHIMTLLRRLEQQKEWEAVNKLVWALGSGGGYLFLQGHFTETILALEAGIRVCQQTGDRQGEGSHSGNLGLAYADLGRYQEAIDSYEQALAISREIGDRRGEGNGLGNLGSAYLSLGRYQEAIGSYEQALAISQEIGDRRGEGNRLGNLGSAYLYLGRYEEAIDSYERALAISREIGDRRGEGNRLGNLGNAYASLGQYQEAIESYERALAISRKIGDRRNEGTWFGNLGSAYRNLGRYQEAIDSYERALVISREIGDRRGEGNRFGNLGNAYLSLGQYEEAINSYERALAISREIGNRRIDGALLGNLGLAYANLGEAEKAMSFYEQADDIDVEIGNIQGHAINLANMGLRYKNDLNDPAKAKALWEEALTIFEKIGHPYADGVRDLLNDL